MPQAFDWIAHFRAQLGYIRWADARSLEAAGSVADKSEYLRDRGISHGSVHKVLLHMMASQANWLVAWGGGFSGERPDTSEAGCPDVESIARLWPGVHQAVETFIAGLSPADLDRPVRFQRQGHEIVLPLYQAISHVLDHANYHRGQLNTLVKLAGGQRTWTSYWIYAMTLYPQPSGVTDATFPR